MCARKFFSAAAVAIGLSSAILPLGCSKGGSPSADPKGEITHIAKAAGHVGKYMGETKGEVPKTTSELKDWASKNNIPEEELLSSRDHEPYDVHMVPKGPTKELVVTEKTGKNGKKFMWESDGPTKLGREVGQEDIDNALKGMAGRPGGAPSR